MSDPVNHPKHYGGDTTYETIKVMEAWDLEAALAFCRFNTVKYLSRVGKKDGVAAQQDYDKAAWYSARAASIHKRLKREKQESKPKVETNNLWWPYRNIAFTYPPAHPPNHPDYSERSVDFWGPQGRTKIPSTFWEKLKAWWKDGTWTRI